MNVKVGEVIYAHDSMGHKLVAQKLIVTKVSCVYFYTSYNGSSDKYEQFAFSIEDGHERVQYGWPRVGPVRVPREAYTEQGWADYKASLEVRIELRDLGVAFNYGRSAYSRASLSQLTRIRDILMEES